MKLNLSKFNVGQRIVNDDGHATVPFLSWINNVVGSFGSAFNSLDDLVSQIYEAVTNAGIAITTAQDAKDIALANSKEAALVGSYVDPGAVLSSDVDPADTTKARISITAHTRKYADGTSVAVNAGMVSGLNLATDYFIVYTDAARTGGDVTYRATSDYLQAAQGHDQHAVGDITTPGTATAPPTTGGGTRPPGTGYCVTADTMILLANAAHDGAGREIEAGRIKLGDYVWTRHEHTLAWGAFPVSFVEHRIEAVLRAPGYADATAGHPWWIAQHWVEMREIGEPHGSATIVHMTVEEAHTFMARHPDSSFQHLAHNKTTSAPEIAA